VFDEVGRFVSQYDVPSTSTESGIFVYPVQNGRADEITGILNDVFTGKEPRGESDRDTTYRNPLAREAKAEKQESESEEGSAEKESDGGKYAVSSPNSGRADVTIGSGSLHGEVKITADEVRNNLIVEATPADYQVIKNLLKEIDTLPRQVLIEVTIAEVTLDKSTELGVEWSYLKGEESLSTSLLEATLGDSGLNYTIGKAERWTATMKALASKNMVNILSSPSIVASNSEEAKIDISSEIPVASSQYEYTSGDNPVVSTNIEYRDTGVMLNVTPHINKNGIVTMEIAQEVSEQAQSVQVGNLNYPSFFKRSADTILTVNSGQTIVIGGLIRENRSDGSSGAPWFINIPVIKYFFGRSSESYEKTELVILISPQVISSLDDVDIVTQEFKKKVGHLLEKHDNSG
jgi:general secretion pathway protein D